MPSFASLNRQIVACENCTRLREHCRNIGEKKRRAYATWTYWAKPVPNYGSAQARLLIVGLAPAAHGANRTGRMFTGDRSGDWLYRALHRAGFANQPESSHARDGLKLKDCAITAICHCAPPDNKPTSEEVEHCRPWFEQTFRLLNAPVVLALGQIAWKGVVDHLVREQLWTARRPKFGHGAVATWAPGRTLLGSYHPSQQNTFTGRLTEEMLDHVMATARRLISE